MDGVIDSLCVLHIAGYGGELTSHTRDVCCKQTLAYMSDKNWGEVIAS
jgi:hypothetical protein